MFFFKFWGRRGNPPGWPKTHRDTTGIGTAGMAHRDGPKLTGIGTISKGLKSPSKKYVKSLSKNKSEITSKKLQQEISRNVRRVLGGIYKGCYSLYGGLKLSQCNTPVTNPPTPTTPTGGSAQIVPMQHPCDKPTHATPTNPTPGGAQIVPM